MDESLYQACHAALGKIGGDMKETAMVFLVCILIGLVVPMGMSAMGHYDLWQFTDSIKTNMFIIGPMHLAISCFIYTGTDEQDKTLPVFTSIS